MIQAEKSRIRNPMRWMNFFNWFNPSGSTRPRGLLSLWHKWVREAEQFFWGVRRGLCVVLTTLRSFVSRLSRQCLDLSQTYRPPRPITGIALLFRTITSASFGPNIKLELPNPALRSQSFLTRDSESCLFSHCSFYIPWNPHDFRGKS
jgi:hypothetical protein